MRRLFMAAAAAATALSLSACGSNGEAAQPQLQTPTTTEAPPEDRMYLVSLDAGSDMSKDDSAMYAISVCSYLEEAYNSGEVMVLMMTETEMYFEPEMRAKLVGGAVGSFCPKFPP